MSGTELGTGSTLLWGNGETLLCYPYFIGGRVYPKPLCWRAWWWSLQVEVERTSLKCPGKILSWICFPVFLSQTCVEHFAPLCYLFVRHLLRKGLKTAKVCLFYLHASVSLGQQRTCCWFSRHPCQDHCWRYYLPHLGTASEHFHCWKCSSTVLETSLSHSDLYTFTFCFSFCL